jgi:serine protease Do
MTGKRKAGLVGGAALIAIGFAVGIFFTSQVDMQVQWRGAPPASDAQSREEIQQAVTKASQTFVSIAKEVSPAVVTVSAAKVFKLSDARRPTPNGYEDGPADPFNFFHRFFEEGPPGSEIPEHRMQGLGSGVIVAEDGYILTNNHVIESADEIEVGLEDGRHLEGKLIGTDPKTDIAVIKIDASGLPIAEMGDSDDLEVGEWVLAIGSPFSENLSHTVTAGIVSGKGRSNVGLTDYEDFIQTDAAINPGNSGGALVNVEGRVIGINTAIATRSGGSQGVGFAIPINMAREVMGALIRDGKVTRGWLGVQIQNLTDELAEAKGLKVSEGVLVGDVLDDGPAEKAGLKRGDVITHFEGRATKNTSQLRNMVARTQPGSRVELTVMRDGHERAVTLELGELKDEELAAAPVVERSAEKLGIEVRPVTPELREQYELDHDEGLVVTDVVRGSQAERQGIREGDMILEINNKTISTLRDYERILDDIDEDETVLFLVEREGTTHFAALKIRPEERKENE